MDLLKLITLISMLSVNAFAEHDATYCGTLERDRSGEGLAILNVTYYVHEGDIWEDNYRESISKAIIYDVNNVKKLMWFLDHSKRDTVFCAKGRWGGAYFSHNLMSDSIERFDYASKFSDSD